MRVGFIGLGVMGRPMAANLARAGHRMSVYARRSEAARPLVEAGAGLCASPAEVAAAAEVVFTMVTAGADVEEIAFGEHGLVRGARPGMVLVDSSTIAPEDARRIAVRLAGHGVEMLDAPVSGGSRGASDASLAIMVGGRAEVLARVRPLLGSIGRTIVHVGPSGAGQVAKACNQMIMVACIEAVAEAMLLARASGVRCDRVRQALSGGSAASRVLDFFGAKMAERDFLAGVQARLHHKDFGILMREAIGLGVALPVVAEVWQQLNALMAHGWGGEDTSNLLRVLETLRPRTS
ncbi:MAG: 2-hydroxy-3-oxopropionate reductase [Rhodocyclales bacterium CG_4_10_14_3_um_filter_68_10]|nr:MAG: 2-hydroxy-3-oxopropionate reductase [Rhodocyclales bacterium CG_4_10_14_3_um_filter_68_10]